MIIRICLELDRCVFPDKERYHKSRNWWNRIFRVQEDGKVGISTGTIDPDGNVIINTN